MTIKNKFFFLLLLLLLITGSNGIAQEFKVKANFELVPATGFYKIPVTPELTGWANGDLSDVRIASDSNKFTPYINRKESVKNNPEEFITCSILSNVTEGKYTSVVLENSLIGGTTNLSLVISNTAVQRFTALSGSDDKNKWYIIDDSILFNRSYRSTEGNYIQTLTFPLIKYKYFKLKINNINSDPLRVIGAGIYKNGRSVATKEYIDNPAPTCTQKDSSNNISYIIIKNKASYLTDKVFLEISGPKFYNRGITAYLIHNEKDSGSINEPVAGFTISSDSSNYFKISNQKAYTIILEINNKDNPPLMVKKVSTMQEMQYLVSWLEKGKTYSLLAGDPNATTPQYDLSHFKDNIPADIPTLSYGTFNLIPKIPPPIIKPSNNYWLWPTIIFGVIVLSFLTYRLMKDMKQSGNLKND